MITITFNPQSAEQVQILAHAMVSILSTGESAQVEELSRDVAAEPAKEAPAKKPRAKAAEASTKSTPASPTTQPADAQGVDEGNVSAATTEEASPTASTASSETSTPAYTLEQVRAKLYALKQAGKDVGALIAATGHPNLTAIPADEYPALMANAEKL